MIELIDIAAPALLVGLLIAIVHVPFGVEVIKRGIIFIDLAIAQIAALGFLSAEIILEDTSPFLNGLSAFVAAVIGGLIFKFIEKHQPNRQEAWIGVFFVASASLSILILSEQPHGAEELNHLLSGQVLFTTYQDFLLYLPVYLILLVIATQINRAMQGLSFYVLFALTITLSVQIVGVYVVFASLIIPALIFTQVTNNKFPYVFTIISIVVGITGSTLLDVPAGPSLVLTYFVMALLSMAAIRRGIR